MLLSIEPLFPSNLGSCEGDKQFQSEVIMIWFEAIEDILKCFVFWVILMRRSNCSAPIPPGQPRGQRKYVCDKKGRGTRKKGDFGDYIGRGK